MRLLMTGGTGVLGAALRPAAEAAGHAVLVPGHAELDLYDAAALGGATRGVDAVLHLATRIPRGPAASRPEAWGENDRLRTEAARNLVDAALAADVATFVQPTITFVYPAEGEATEATPVADVAPNLRSALAAEREAGRFAAAGRRGVVLRFGMLDGPGTGHDEPVRRRGASLHVDDAATSLLAAPAVPSGIYNVCRDGERVSNRRFSETAGCRPVR